MALKQQHEVNKAANIDTTDIQAEENINDTCKCVNVMCNTIVCVLRY